MTTGLGHEKVVTNTVSPAVVNSANGGLWSQAQ